MYTLHQLIALAMVVISPARIVAALPFTIPSTPAVASAQTIAPHNLALTTTDARGVVAAPKPLPNFDTEVLAPLRAAQAEVAAQSAAAKRAAALAAARAKQTVTTVVNTADGWYRLRLCEAGNDYTKNTGNGYFGAYQYSNATWNKYAGFARADLAPAEIQDAKAQADFARRGASPWPHCGRYLSAK
jgi:hypothetical protein